MAASSKCFKFLTKTSHFRRCKLNNNIGALFFTYRNYCSVKRQDDSIRIGCASGFWGDSAVAAPQLIHKGDIDFLVSDYLSEITMSLLTAVKTKRPEFGYAPDFVHVAIGPYVKAIKEKGIRVVSNAGGVNPQSCAKALQDLASKSGVDLKIAVVTGDDLMFKKDEYIAKKVKDMDSGRTFPESVNSMNAYIGAFPIAMALDMGADVVITGRCVDSALALGPLIHQFKWTADQFDLLASGSLAGHLIECGAQVTGGIFTDWHKHRLDKQWATMGFPIAQCRADGTFSITKPAGTGGLVSKGTVAEQLVYEIGDPRNYILPDVVCDFTNVQLTETKENEVQVTGVRGKPPSKYFKVSATYADGFRATGIPMVAGPRSQAKGIATVNAVLQRTRGIFKQLKLDDYSRTHVKVIGADQLDVNKAIEEGSLDSPQEVAVWMAVEHKQKKALEVFAMEIAPAGTGMAPGLTGLVGGRPKVSPVFKYFPFLCEKSDIDISVELKDDHRTYAPASFNDTDHQDVPIDPAVIAQGEEEYRLEELAYTRSGDKGNTVNIGVVARHPDLVPYINAALSEETVGKYFGHLFEDDAGKTIPDGWKLTQRYYLPGINAFNFVLPSALGGGGVASLRPDPQGKAAGQHLLNMKVKGPARSVLDKLLSNI